MKAGQDRSPERIRNQQEQGKKKRLRPVFRRTGFPGGITALVLFIAVLVGLNIGVTTLEKKQGWKKDFSFNGITTQSEITKQTIEGLAHPVHIYALFSKGQEDAPLMELLDRYAASSEKITWEQADPSLNPGLLTRFGSDTESVSSDSLIVYCAETDRWRLISPAEFISLSMDTETGTYSYAGYTYERAITGALTYVTREEIPRIVVLQGHGELDGETLSSFDRLMTENYREVIYRDLSRSDYTPDPGDLLVFFSPMRDLTGEELDKILAFTEAGGSLFFTCDYTDPTDEMPNYLTLMRAYGFRPKEGIVVAGREDPDSYYQNTRINLIPTMKSTNVTMDLLASGANTVLMPGSRAFELPEETDRSLSVFTVLESGADSYLKKLSSAMTSMEKEEEDEKGPFALALQAERITESGNISRAFICGCSGMLTEEQVYAMTDVRQLILRMTDYLAGYSGTSLNISARTAVRPGLSARGNGLGSLIVAILPLTVLLAALIELIRRKSR